MTWDDVRRAHEAEQGIAQPKEDAREKAYTEAIEEVAMRYLPPHKWSAEHKDAVRRGILRAMQEGA